MNSIKLFNRQTGSVAVIAALLLAMVAPSLVSAAQVTERSIALSNSSKLMTGVTYQVKFKSGLTSDTAGAFVVEFCGNTPLIGQSCSVPAGFDATAAASTTSGFTGVTGSATKIIVVGEIENDDDVEVAITGIKNPDEAGPLYARIVTYDTQANAIAYTSTNLGTGNIDDGGVAISITDTVGVSGAVLESMTFCVASVNITENCGNAAANQPILPLGEEVGDVIALSPGVVSEGNLYTQLSTNAAGGAIISLKSNATNCGGLLRAGAPGACDIKPASEAGVSGSVAGFGVKTGVVGDAPEVTGSGTLRPFGTYNASTFALNFAPDNTTGVTSTYGDAIIDTDDAPVNNKNMPLTFGASITNDTPAGLYSTDLSLIATGKF